MPKIGSQTWIVCGHGSGDSEVNQHAPNQASNMKHGSAWFWCGNVDCFFLRIYNISKTGYIDINRATCQNRDY